MPEPVTTVLMCYGAYVIVDRIRLCINCLNWCCSEPEVSNEAEPVRVFEEVNTSASGVDIAQPEDQVSPLVRRNISSN